MLSPRTHSIVLTGALIIGMIIIALIAGRADAAPRKPFNIIAINMMAPKVSRVAVYHTALASKTTLPWRPIAFAVGRPAKGCQWHFDGANQVFWLDRGVRSNRHLLMVRAQLTFGMFADAKVREAACHGAIR
jgi:hypothetical protein